VAGFGFIKIIERFLRVTINNYNPLAKLHNIQYNYSIRYLILIAVKVKFKVDMTLRLAVYSQSFRLAREAP
jgi:hypothetical protein